MTRTYFICCVPRSGSWLLADALDRTGVAGHPEEYFRDEDLCEFLEPWRDDAASGLRSLVAEVIAAGKTPNGVFGAKVHWSQLEDIATRLRALPELARLTRRELMEAVFGRAEYIHLTRRDKLRQAISYYRALDTDVWWWTGAANTSPRPALDVPDTDEIDVLEQLLRAHDEAWLAFFAESGIEPLTVEFEELCENYAPTVKAVLEFLQLPSERIPPARLRRQADDLSQEWVHRCIATRRAREAPDVERYGVSFSEMTYT